MRVGAYELLERIGQGSAAAVYRARDAGGRDLAVKLLARTTPRDLARFDRERRLLAELGEEAGFVPLLDAGSSPQGIFLVMPLLAGGTLRARLREGPLGVAETVALGRALGAALGAAHAREIVHRDVKPENILFTKDGRPLLADLGIARHVAGEGAAPSVVLSRTGELVGTAGYMAPEQIEDPRAVGPRADVFALGAVLHECLAGAPPFLAASAPETLQRVLAGRPEPLAAARPDAPRALVRVVERALAHDPAARFADGAALAAALAPEPPRRRPVALVLALLVVAASALAVAAFAWPRGEAPVVVVPPLSPLAQADVAFEKSAWSDAAAAYERARAELPPGASLPELAARRQMAARVLADGRPTLALLEAPRAALLEPPLSLACAALYRKAVQGGPPTLDDLERLPVPAEVRRAVAEAYLRAGLHAEGVFEGAGSQPDSLPDPTDPATASFPALARSAKPLIDALVKARSVDPSIGPYPPLLERQLGYLRIRALRLAVRNTRDVFEGRKGRIANPEQLPTIFAQYPDHPLGIYWSEFGARMGNDGDLRAELQEKFLAVVARLDPVPREVRMIAHSFVWETINRDVVEAHTPELLAFFRKLAAIADDAETWGALAKVLEREGDAAGAAEARARGKKARPFVDAADE